MRKRQSSARSILGITRTADSIPDPLQRLRFLRSAAPCWQLKSRGSLWTKFSVVGPVLALFGLLVLGGLAMDLSKAYAQVVGKAANLEMRSPPASSLLLSPELPAQAGPGSIQEIWQVEKLANSENYSNGLHIENKFSTGTHRRTYLVFAAPRFGERPDGPGGAAVGRPRTEPAGIVYHTTESLLAPFRPEQNGRLKKVGESLLEYVRRRTAYNFLIDRFGRVFRVVREEDAADHAGYSVWADEQWLYVNLNESFLGVALESQTQPGQVMPLVTEAQIRAAAMLTEMLRSRYAIAAGNCVTHAQVSVSPANMLAGYHMDWASSFPFAAIGLPDNYAHPLPSVAVFGFKYDGAYGRMAGTRLFAGANSGERELIRRAAAAGVGVPVYRKMLQRQYRERLAATRHTSQSEEGG